MGARPQEAALGATIEALAHPARRAILRRLSRGEARVTELAEPFDMSLNAVSKHIRVLEQARLVRRRRDGREHFITADPRPLDDVSRWIDEQRAAWAARLDAMDAALRDRRQSERLTHRKLKGERR